MFYTVTPTELKQLKNVYVSSNTQEQLNKKQESGDYVVNSTLSETYTALEGEIAAV